MAERGPKRDDMGVDWDAEALRAAAVPFPYTSGSFFEYFRDLIKPHDKVLDLGCNIASWIWAWRDVELTIEYHGLDWSEVALKIANERYGPGGLETLPSSLARYPQSRVGLVPATFHLCDARELDFTDFFDIVFTHTFYQHTNLETKQMVLPRVYKALKPGGLHIIQENTTYESNGTWFTEGWIKFFQGFGFKLERVKDFHDGGSGFVFRRPY